MAHHISQLESELQNIPEAAPKASPSFSVSEKLVRYGSSALSGVEHLTLLVGRKSVALALIRHFGSLKAMARASFQELRQEVLRVILLDTRYRHISTVEITKGSINESLAHPCDIFRPVISQSAFAFVLVHNLWGATQPSLGRSGAQRS
jgi:DNA repair protein RadC